MKLFISLFLGFLFLGCAPLKKGDYVTFTSDKYLFMQDSFIDKKMDCLILGKLGERDLDVKYCVGFNYASQAVQGFVFRHEYETYEKRYLGSTLSFKTKSLYTIACKTETIDESASGVEYINCMVPHKRFDIYSFIVNSKNNIHGVFRSTLGSKKEYKGVIRQDGKKALVDFYKNLRNKNSEKWKKGSL
ncbi:MAG TPA: hypothetical protein EYO73_04045 [Sulfurimonas sp.]|nr:hypothetical protein [Sulfurimonas sp.]